MPLSFTLIFHVASTAWLVLLPPPADVTRRIHDFAGLLVEAERDKLEQQAQEVENATTAQLAVVTVKSLDGMTVDAFANSLFNRWGIGRRDVNNGVLFLIAADDRRTRIEVGYGLEPLLTDALCGEILDQSVIPAFQRGDFSAGIVNGTRRIAEILLANPAAARGDPNSEPFLARSARQRAVSTSGAACAAALLMLVLDIAAALRRLYSTTLFLAATGLVALLLGIACFCLAAAREDDRPLALFGGASAASVAAWAYNWRKYRRYGPHGCSKCGSPLELLSEQDDDPKLSAVQRLEEQIGSVDYDVWICTACLNADTERYLKPFSGFSNCAACHARTFKEDPQEVVRPATTSSAGLVVVHGRCISCNHKGVRKIVLARTSTSTSSGSSSGGGGFGGGSSGGGGASRGW